MKTLLILTLLCLTLTESKTGIFDSIIDKLNVKPYVAPNRPSYIVKKLQLARVPITLSNVISKSSIDSLGYIQVSQRAINFFKKHLNDKGVVVNVEDSFNYWKGRMNITRYAYGMEVDGDKIKFAYFEVEIENNIIKRRKRLVPCSDPTADERNPLKQQCIKVDDYDLEDDEIEQLHQLLVSKCNEVLLPRIKEIKSIVSSSVFLAENPSLFLIEDN